MRAARQDGEHARVVAALVVFLPLVDLVGAAREHAVDQAGHRYLTKQKVRAEGGAPSARNRVTGESTARRARRTA